MLQPKTIIAALLSLVLLLPPRGMAQQIETRSYFYNTLIGGFSAGIGAVINKKPDQKWHQAFAKGFLTGIGGGSLMYAGKKMNYWVARKRELGYAWLSRLVFNTGNSVIENAAANRPFWSVWHYDVGFVRIEFHTKEFRVKPRVMFSTFWGTVFLAVRGRFDLKNTLRSGTPVFRTEKINYSPRFLASTPTNGFMIRDSVFATSSFYDICAHELIHTFQFKEFSGCNYFFKPLADKWKTTSEPFRKWSRWIYGDLNYEIMGINYFLVQRGHQYKDYCKNFLENEAETLSTGRPACP